MAKITKKKKKNVFHLPELLLKGLLAWAMLSLTLNTSVVWAQRDLDPCRLFADGTKLRDPDDCSQELVCENFKSSKGLKCSGSTPFYNKDTQKCVKSLTDDTNCSIDCKTKAGKFVTDPKSCFSYYYCQDEIVALHGACPLETHFNETRQACIQSFRSECSISTINFCSIVKSEVNFKDESYCGGYFVCEKKNNTLQHKNCPDKTLFYDASQGKCVAEALPGCHPLPSSVCGTKLKPVKNKLVSDGATCRGYFFCADVGKEPDANPIWLQCPANTFFSESAQKCLPPLEVRCEKDRCEGRQLQFVVSSEKGCRSYQICKNGRKTGESTCGNYFFDEVRSVCTSEIVTHAACYY